MDQRDKLKPPDTTWLEAGSAVLEAAMSLAAPVGGPLAAGVSFLTQRVISARTDAFLTSVLAKMEKLDLSITDINESFVSRLLQATEAARRTQLEEKHEALRNAVVHTLLPNAPDEDLQHIFVGILDELTSLHLRLFGFLVDPVRFGMVPEDAEHLHGINPNNFRATWDAIEQHVAPGVRRDLIQLCLNDLERRGLAEYRNDMDQFGGAVLPWPTTIGNDFYSFTLAAPNKAQKDNAESAI